MIRRWLTPFRAVALCAAALLSSSCAPIPQPRVLVEADRTSTSPAVLAAKEHAPAAYAEAERRRREAHQMSEEGFAAHAQFLGESALAGYAEAAAIAREAQAALREQRALAEATAVQKELTTLEADLARATSEVDALEMRLKVSQGLQPIVASKDASPEREAARRAAARAMLVQGRLLCAAARVVGSGAAPAARPPGPGARHDSPETDAATLATELTAAEAKLTELDAAVGPDAKDPKAVPIDLATRTRAACLGLLTRARRAQSSTAAKGAGSSDALLQELSAFAARVGGMSPERDERGVVLVLRSVFDTKDGLTAPAKSALSEVDRVAAAHPSFPVAVVVHSDRALATADRARWQARVKAIGDLLGSVPENRRVLLVAGDAVPVVDGKGKDRAKNDRVEIVFISPEAL